MKITYQFIAKEESERSAKEQKQELKVPHQLCVQVLLVRPLWVTLFESQTIGIHNLVLGQCSPGEVLIQSVVVHLLELRRGHRLFAWPIFM